MRRILLAIGCVAASLLTASSLVAQQPQAARPKVLAFFTPGGELDHFVFAQQAMRARGMPEEDAIMAAFELNVKDVARVSGK